MFFPIIDFHRSGHGSFGPQALTSAIIVLSSILPNMVSPFELDFEVISAVANYLKVGRAVVVCRNFTMANAESRKVFGHFGRSVKFSTDLEFATEKLHFADGLFVCLEDYYDLQGREGHSEAFFSERRRYFQTNNWVLMRSGERRLKPLQTGVFQRIFHLDSKQGLLYESFSVNGVEVTNDIGQLIPSSTQGFVLEQQHELGFISRRSNLQGLEYRVLVESQYPYLYFKQGKTKL